MSTGSRVAGAVAAGYALGRFKKLRLAVLVATAMSSPKFRDAAFELIENRIPGGAIVGTLGKEVGGKLLDAGKTAATSVVASRIDSLSENLAGRSKTMRDGAPNGQSRSPADKAADDRGPAEPEDESSDEEEPEAEYDEEEETDEAEEPEAEYDEEEETDEAEEPEAEYDEEEETDEAEEPEAEYDEEEETDEAQEPEAEEPEAEDDKDAARVRDDGDSVDEQDEEPVARSPRRRRSASPAGRRRG
jgi:hypothetical protein